MKKITFILFALITGTTFAQADQASGTAQAFAEIVSPISIDKITDLNFGRIIVDGTGGDVIIGTDNSRTAVNNGLLVNTGDTPTAADFDVTAALNYTYTISLPETVTLSSGTNEITIKDFTSSLGSSSTGTGTAQDLFVGGTLTVAASQAEGEYAGDVKVTVAYQ